ncbi:MAG: serine hydrolase [Thermoanaerobaculia bacterium]
MILALLFALLAPDRLDRIDRVVREAIARRELPGAVVLVGRGDATPFRRAYGQRALQPKAEPMTPDTVFDAASLTKPVATATSVMILVEEGKLRLADPVIRHLPEFGAPETDRAKITIEHLLTHRAGFVADDPLELYTGSSEEIFARKYRQPLEAAPGARFRYSDVGYEVLGEVVRRVSGKSLDVFATERIFRPLGMKDTHFRPLAGRELPIPPARIAPTERREERWLRGEVHDPRAFALGGVAGHAGLFSTADDLARYCRMILAGGKLGDARILSPLGVEAMIRPRSYGDETLRALGWDVASAYSSNRGDLFPPGSFGHTGFTGTSLWIDPASRTFVVFLSNRLHPEGKGDVTPLRGIVTNLAAAAILDDVRPAARKLSAKVPILREVKTGLDVLAEEGFKPIAGKRIGVVTNTTGKARDGRTTVQVLRSEAARKAGVEVTLLFAPEHGLEASREGPLGDAIDPSSGIRVRSLYGEAADRRPRPEDLARVQAVVFDIQDVGVRFYTYLTTLGYLLEEAAKARVPVVVLDRPNPINGLQVEGPPADPDSYSFTAYHAIPVRIGMTIGELARLFNAERKIGADLTVVPMRGWSRDLWYDETGLEWVNPSPNMRSLTAATLYPGVGLLELTNVSVGRGTDTPFEILGAPWMDGAKLARIMTARNLPGVRFTPIRFTPTAAVHAGQSCGGIRISVVDRDALRPVALSIELAAALRDLHPVDWDRKNLNRLMANQDVVRRLEQGESAHTVVNSWKIQLAAFWKVRARHLLYPLGQ